MNRFSRGFRWIIFSVVLLLSLLFSLVGPLQVIPVQAAGIGVCGTPGRDGTVTISTATTVNTYFPGVGTASGTAITVGAASASGALNNILAGDLLLVIQVQGADVFINPANPGDNNYGANTGSGAGNLNNANFTAGQYEYVVATNNVTTAGGTITLNGAGLVNTYTTQDYPVGAGNQGQRRFQVIRVPQYLNLTITATGSAQALAWNGSVGGVVALDVANMFNLANNANGNINVAGRGFRGGGGVIGGGRAGTLPTDYWTTSPTPNGSKAEGTAGTPRYIFDGAAVVDGGIEGYPGGTMGRGAPGNAGGGGTDGRPTANDHNSGGGGGGNGGSGGTGGYSWSSILDSGGLGGASFPENQNRLALGGGGGAGSINNNNPLVSSGGAGAGLVLVRAGALTGSGTVNANGSDGQDQPLNDSGGGGGAGGSVILLATSWNPTSLTIQANGGQGGDAWSVSDGGTVDELATGSANNRHGPGAGGGGGVIYVSSLTNVATNVAGGLNGLTTTDLSNFGAQPGNPGVVHTVAGGVACIADLAISKTDGSATFTPGGSITYTIGVTNNGPSNVVGATISDTLPATISGATWTCIASPGASCSASGSGNINDTVNIPLAGTLAYTLTGLVSASATGSLVNTATVAVPPGYTDPVTNNNTATDVDTFQVADLAITKTDGSATYTPGGGITYTITVTNSGPSDVTGATVADTVPTAISGVTWTCAATPGASCAASGSGNINDTVNIPFGGALTYTLSGTVSASATGALSNTATVTAPLDTTDSNLGNNTATDSDTSLVADLLVTKTDGSAVYTPGGTITYTIVVTNNGPSDVTGATVTDNVPATITGVTWTCVPGTGASCSASGAGNINDTVNIPAGEILTYTLTGTVSPSATGNLVNTVSVTPPTGVTDPNLGNNNATDTDTMLVADLAITKTDGSAIYTPGGSITYTVVVTNNGPSNVVGATVSDPLPASISGVSWLCVPGTGASCAASGLGNITDTVNIPSGVSVTYTVTGTVSASAAGNLVNTATVTPPTGVNDPISDNNTSTDIDTLLSADLAITKTDNSATYSPGGTITYTVVATNNGPNDVSGATVTDTVPAEISSVTWTCVASPGASCSASGSGNINDTVNIPVAGTLTYTLTGTVAASATGSLSNMATISNPPDVNDPFPDNDTHTDVDLPFGMPILEVTKDDGQTIVAPGAVLTYAIVVTNTGTQTATGVTVVDTLPADVIFVSADRGGIYASATHSVSWPSFTLAVGAVNAQEFHVTVKVKDAAGATLPNEVIARDDGSSTNGIPVESSDTDTDQVIAASVKFLVGSSDSGSTDPKVLIGEMLTYQISLDIPTGTLKGLTALDVLDHGLAFVRCISIDAGTLTTTLPGGFSSACNAPANPRVFAQPQGNTNKENQGRRILFTLGDVTNAGSGVQTIQVQYEVVVLDIKTNANGVGNLDNKVTWDWDGGALSGAARPVRIIEPVLTITKAADRTVAVPGTKVRFTLTVTHAKKSNAVAYDAVVLDNLPKGLAYVPGSLKIASGPAGGVANDSSAPKLKVSWPVFDLDETAEIVFDTIYNGPGRVTNIATVDWSSLMIDPKGPQSTYNATSKERLYNSANNNGLAPEPGDDDDEEKPKPPETPPVVITPLAFLPVTGFAPQVVTNLPAQPASKRYAALGGTWLEIPDLGLALPITGVPLTSTGWDLTWLSREAGYLEGTTYPGQVGNTGITAHVYLADGTPGPFVNLHKLSWGRQVILHADGYRYTYEVRENRTVSPSDMTVFKPDGYTWLTLLTCKDYNRATDSYASRLAVRAVLLKVEADN